MTFFIYFNAVPANTIAGQFFFFSFLNGSGKNSRKRTFLYFDQPDLALIKGPSDIIRVLRSRALEVKLHSNKGIFYRKRAAHKSFSMFKFIKIRDTRSA